MQATSNHPETSVSSDKLWWSHNVQPMEFDSVPDLLTFVSKSHKIMTKVINNNEHDRVTFFLDFYEGFKSQTSSLAQYFILYEEKIAADENRRDCIGRYFKLKLFLRRELENEYPGLGDKLYAVSNSFDYQNIQLNLTKEMEDNHHHFVNFNEHTVLTLKIDVSGRTGFVLFEMSFLNSEPVIVMKDNQYPSHGVVTLPMGRQATYICTGDKFVRVLYDRQEGAATDGMTGFDAFELALYIQGAFLRPDISAKYALLPNMQYKYAFGGDSLVAIISRYGDSDQYNLQRWDTDTKEYIKSKIPLSYFLQDKTKDQSFEDELRKVAFCLREPVKELKGWMTALGRVQQDKSFLEEHALLPMRLKATRKCLLKDIP